MGPGGGPSLSDSGTLIRSPPTLLVTASLRSFLPTLFLHAASCTEFSKRFRTDVDVRVASWLARPLGKVLPSGDTGWTGYFQTIFRISICFDQLGVDEKVLENFYFSNLI